MPGRILTPEQREAAERGRREVVEQLHEQLAAHIGALDNRDEWQRYLTFSRSFHQYSFANSLLLMMQSPQATAVAGYRAWQAKGYQVRRGEKALKVLGPVTRSVPVFDRAGKQLLDDHGQPRVRREMIGVRPVSVWDISQTDGPPVPQAPRPVLLTGQAPAGLWDALADIVAAEGYNLQRGECGGANGVTNFTDRVVRVRDDVDDAQAVRTLAHEVGHVLLTDPAASSLDCRGLREVEAESVALTLIWTRRSGWVRLGVVLTPLEVLVQ